MAPPIRVALLGYGLAGAVFHAPLIASVDGLELAAIVTRNEERRTRARREHPGALLLGSTIRETAQSRGGRGKNRSRRAARVPFALLTNKSRVRLAHRRLGVSPIFFACLRRCE